MTTTQTATANGTAAKAGQPVGLLPCPCCGEGQATISLNLADFEFTCMDCEATFTRDDLEAFLRKWTAVLRWLDGAPTVE